jgi:hypothetical protein
LMVEEPAPCGTLRGSRMLVDTPAALGYPGQGA